jgi:hypothetical protein
MLLLDPLLDLFPGVLQPNASQVVAALRVAVEAVFGCAAELDCEGVNDWLQRVPPDAYPCLSEVARCATWARLRFSRSPGRSTAAHVKDDCRTCTDC